MGLNTRLNVELLIEDVIAGMSSLDVLRILTVTSMLKIGLEDRVKFGCVADALVKDSLIGANEDLKVVGRGDMLLVKVDP